MRKSRAMTPRRKRDVRRYRFPVTNEIFWMRFTPVEFAILAYLHYCRIHRENDVITVEDVAEHIHVKPQAAKKTIDDLIKYGLVSEELRLTRVIRDTRNYFTLPNEIFMLGLPPTAFTVYAYLLYEEDRKTHSCHPSYEKIGRHVGKSKNTVRKYVAELEERKLISAAPTFLYDRYGHPRNGTLLYKILPIQNALDAFYEKQLRQTKPRVVLRRRSLRSGGQNGAAGYSAWK